MQISLDLILPLKISINDIFDEAIVIVNAENVLFSKYPLIYISGFILYIKS